MKPSEKSPEIESFLNSVTNRTEAITADRCINPPFGCGQPVEGFRDELSMKEFTISGLCQKCQDKIFTPPEEEDSDDDEPAF